MEPEGDILETLRLLVAEDSEDDYLLLLGEIWRGGFAAQPLLVDNAAAFKAALQEPWDMIISDYHIPGFGGLEALALRNRLAPDVPFIIVSGAIGEETAVEAMRKGASDYLMKNNLVRLAPAIRRELAEAKQRQGRRRAEAELTVAQERFRLVAKAASDAIFDWNAVNDEVWFSESMKTRFLHPVEVVAGGRAWRMNLVHPEDRPAVEKSWSAARGSGHDHWTSEYRMMKGDGTWARVMERSHLIHDARAGLSRVVGALIDVSETRRLEEQFQQAQKMEVLGRLAGGVAHDFNNVLAVVIGLSTLMLDHCLEGDPQRARLEEIRQAGELGAQIVHQLLAFSRRQEIKPVALDINRRIKGLGKMLRRLIGHEILLTTDLEDNLGSVRMDPAQMEQVLLNLAVNARDAMAKGGELTIETRNVMVEQPSEAPPDLAAGACVRLTVKDTGHGMDEATVTRIFEPFFTTKEPGKGTGLGLATVFGVVKQSGGWIEVDSKPGQGTAFHIFLPRVTKESSGTQELKPSVYTDRGGARILVVEDTDAIRLMVKVVLEGRGYQVLEATNGEEGLRVCQENSGAIQLVLTDHQMPLMSGMDMVEKMRQRWPELKIVMMSGSERPRPTRQSERGVLFLTKPFSAQELTRLVGEVLSAGGSNG